MIPYEDCRPSRREPITPAERRAGWFAWLAIVATFLLLALAGCRTTPRPDERPNASIVPRQIPADTVAAASVPDSITVTPRQTLLDKLRGRTPVPRRIPAGTVVHTGKKATVNIYNAPTVITTIGKKATAATGAAAHVAIAGKKAQQATDSAAAISSAGGAVAAGAGASATGGAAVTKPGFWQSPAGYTAAAVLAGIGGYGLYLAWPVLLALLPKRRKDPIA